MEDSPPPNEDVGEENEQETEEERCQYFSSSSAFKFMTDGEFERVEGVKGGEESEYAFCYVRPMNAVVGVLDNPHGSVRLTQGDTTVIAAVYGPSDVRMSKEMPHRAAVDVLFRPKVTGSANTNTMISLGFMDPVMEERAFEQTVTSILETVLHLEDHMQAGFNVILHEVEDKGCLLSTCVNAASLALLNAGCSLRCMFAAVSVAVSGDKIIIDPSSEQIQAFKNRRDTPFCLVTLTITNNGDRKTREPQVVQCSSYGVISPLMLSKVYSLVTETPVMCEVFEYFWKVISSDVVGACGVGGGDLQFGNVTKDDQVEEGEID